MKSKRICGGKTERANPTRSGALFHGAVAKDGNRSAVAEGLATDNNIHHGVDILAVVRTYGELILRPGAGGSGGGGGLVGAGLPVPGGGGRSNDSRRARPLGALPSVACPWLLVEGQRGILRGEIARLLVSSNFSARLGSAPKPWDVAWPGLVVRGLATTELSRAGGLRRVR